jgi:hypothetical protein
MAGRSVRVYGTLLWLLPGPFRREYGEAMPALRHNPQHVSEFVHSGQRDVAAYIVGERISGGMYGIVFGLAAGVLFGVLSLPAGRVRHA